MLVPHRQADMLPAALLQHVARQVLFVQPLHDDHAAGVARRAAGGHRQIPPVDDGFTFGLALGLLDVVRVVNHDSVGVLASAVAAGRRGQAIAAARVFVIGFLVLIVGQRPLMAPAIAIPPAGQRRTGLHAVARAQSLVVGVEHPSRLRRWSTPSTSRRRTLASSCCNPAEC